MITRDMTREEVWKHFLSCHERFKPWLLHKIEDWRKIVKKQPPKWFGGKVFTWEYKPLHLKVLSVHLKLMNSGYKHGHSTFIPLVTERGTQYYKLHSETKGIYIYTPHFMKRYAERMGFLQTMPKNLDDFEVRNPAMLTIYEEPDTSRYVLAVRDGLVLARYDEKRHITICCTFVSNALLRKDTEGCS